MLSGILMRLRRTVAPRWAQAGLLLTPFPSLRLKKVLAGPHSYGEHRRPKTAAAAARDGLAPVAAAHSAAPPGAAPP